MPTSIRIFPQVLISKYSPVSIVPTPSLWAYLQQSVVPASSCHYIYSSLHTSTGVVSTLTSASSSLLPSGPCEYTYFNKYILSIPSSNQCIPIGLFEYTSFNQYIPILFQFATLISSVSESFHVFIRATRGVRVNTSTLRESESRSMPKFSQARGVFWNLSKGVFCGYSWFLRSCLGVWFQSISNQKTTTIPTQHKKLSGGLFFVFLCVFCLFFCFALVVVLGFLGGIFLFVCLFVVVFFCFCFCFVLFCFVFLHHETQLCYAKKAQLSRELTCKVSPWRSEQT